MKHDVENIEKDWIIGSTAGQKREIGKYEYGWVCSQSFNRESKKVYRESRSMSWYAEVLSWYAEV